MKPQLIEDLMIGAFEGGSNYWYFLPDLTMVKRSGYLSEDVMNSVMKDEQQIPIHDVENPDELLGYLTQDGVQNAVKLMHDHYPQHYSDAITENYDAVTSDVFFQLAVFKEIVYG